MNYEYLLNRSIARRSDPNISARTKYASIHEEIEGAPSARYALLAMQPVDPAYTEETLKQGARIRNQLEKVLDTHFCYEFQGSTTNGTNIKSHSDIDLLCITGEFVYLAPSEPPRNNYAGNPAKHLKEKRDSAADHLDGAFPAAEVDTTGDKSVAIDGGSLTRKVDVVAAAWENTDEWLHNRSKIDRAVRILDSSGHQNDGWGALLSNTPFRFNFNVDAKDARMLGGLRKAARFLKTLKYDNSDINISSYDIVSIAYNIDEPSYFDAFDNDLKIVSICRDFCRKLLDNRIYRESLYSPDSSRKIFEPEGPTSLEGLKALSSDLDSLQVDIDLKVITELRKSSSYEMAAARATSDDLYPNYQILERRDL